MRCEAILLGDSIATYLGSLVDQHVLTGDDFAVFVGHLKKGKLVNPISLARAQESSALLIHHRALEHLLPQIKPMTFKRLKKWSEEYLQSRQQDRIEQELSRAETLQIEQPAVFHRLDPGSFQFKLGLNEPVITATIEHAFWMMSHLVTQRQWVMVMNSNPSFFKRGSDEAVINRDGLALYLQPNHPIENISRDAIVHEFLPKINKLAEENSPLIYELIKDHQKGDIYRLPTEAEWVYVTSNLGRWGEDSYSMSYPPANIDDHAWHKGNARKTTHPVGKLSPLLIDGDKGFYDLFGNVWEWLEDRYHSSNATDAPPSSKSPRSEAFGLYVLRGGSWDTIPGVRARWSLPSNTRADNCGFRLVRIRP